MLEGLHEQVKTGCRQREGGGALGKGEEKRPWKAGWLLQIKKSCTLVNFLGDRENLI